MPYQRHSHRTEVWTFTEGVDELIWDGEIKEVYRSDVAVIKAGMKYAVKGITLSYIVPKFRLLMN